MDTRSAIYDSNFWATFGQLLDGFTTCESQAQQAADDKIRFW